MSDLSEIENIFQPPASGRILVITVGNPYRSDDGVGPYIADGASNPKGHIIILNAGERPENIIFKAIEAGPRRTIIVDAANFGGRPGELRLIPESAVPDVTNSTHSFPLNIVSRMIADDTGSEVFFLGIQLQSAHFGEGLTPEVKASADRLIELISDTKAIEKIA